MADRGQRIVTPGTISKRSRWDERKRAFLDSVRRERGVAIELEHRTGSRWARCPAGAVAVLGSGDHGGKWWFGVRDEEFLRRNPLGVILLCDAEEGLFHLGLAARRVRELLPQLSREGGRGERKLNLFRRGSRFVVQIPGGRDVDVSDARGDLSWLLAARSPASGVGEPPSHVDGGLEGVPLAFFARVRKGVLEPLDAIALSDGDVVRVVATPAPTVPRSAALRRIVARGGPASLPRDFAEKHDHYAHGGVAS